MSYRKVFCVCSFQQKHFPEGSPRLHRHQQQQQQQQHDDEEHSVIGSVSIDSY